MSIVRVREGVHCVTFDSRTQTYVAMAPGIEFDADDPFVKENAWAFTTDAEKASSGAGRKRVTAVAIEDASATPGTKRNR